MTNQVHPHVKCLVHGTDMVRKTNHRNPGSVFYGCCLFESQGCKVSWSDRDQRYFNDPTVVAKGSSRRGRVTSKREEVITLLVGRGAGTRAEAEELLDTVGLESCLDLVNDHAAE